MLLLRVLLDEQEVINYRGDLVNEVFHGYPEVYWGITAATGRKVNRHSLCFEQLEYIPGLESKSFSLDFIRQLENGQQIDLPGLYFPSDTSSMAEDPTHIKYRLLHFLRHHPSYRLNILGHARAFEEETQNISLSKTRAEEVVQFLLDHGIAKDRLGGQGQGSNFLQESSDGKISVRAFINRT